MGPAAGSQTIYEGFSTRPEKASTVGLCEYPTKSWVTERVFGESGSARLPPAPRHGVPGDAREHILAMQDMF